MDFEQISRSLLHPAGRQGKYRPAPRRCATPACGWCWSTTRSPISRRLSQNRRGERLLSRNTGQMQIIFGTGVVNKVYAAFIQAAGISESEQIQKPPTWRRKS
ncbi:hypothetical protein MJ560_07785 [Klebsiella pneumoniae]|nr:hypothetical protein MJ560_07785 [Klebsiella pneumoniae]